MKVFVVYASAGAGHLKAAEAIYAHLKRSRPDLTTEYIDILRYTNPAFRVSYNGYSFLIKYAPSLWRLGFLITAFKLLRPFTRPLARLINRINARRFSAFLTKENPDCVVSTHFFPSEIAASLKARRAISSRIITVITDFGVHPFWINAGTDLYIVASDATGQKLAAEGVPGGLIAALGIPVNGKFLEEFHKDELRKKFGLREDRCTVLLATGSFGIGPIEKIAAALSGSAQVLAVCARNEKLFASLQKKNYPGVRVFGFVDNIQELMAVSQIIITKPGGLSIAESLVMELFPIFISPIPGQETENVRVLGSYGLGICTDDIAAIKGAVRTLCGDPGQLEKARAVIRRLKKPGAVKDICDAIR